VGEHDEGDVPDDGLVAAVAAAAADDPLHIVWDCWFDGSALGYTGVELCSGLDPDDAVRPGYLEVFVTLDARTRHPVEAARGIAAAARVTLTPDGRYRR
jgi:hypothetical protein